MGRFTDEKDVVLLERRGPIAIVTINRPERRNAVSQAVLREGAAIVEELKANEVVQAVVVTGAGGAFCAGLDLEALGDGDIEVEGGFIGGIQELPQATIAAIDGPAYTGGLELALSCDIRLATPAARFGDTHVRVGIPPGAGLSVLLPALIGYGRAKEMSLSGRAVGAEEAERWGLVNRIVDGDVVAAAVELGETIAANGPFSRHIKGLINDGLDRTLFDALRNERALGEEFIASFDPSAVQGRAQDIIKRGKAGS
jgi:enoyl-CoA hydratase